VVTQVLAAGASDCERIRHGLFDQPEGALSALAYVAVGIWIATRFRWPAGAFGVLVAALEIGSIGYHGWNGRVVEVVHGLTNTAVIVAVIAYGLVRLRTGVRRRPAGYGIAIGALAVGLTMNLLGGTDGPLCAPRSIIQWHAFWHVATAVALGAWAWSALVDADRREVGWDGSRERPRSSPAPAKGSAGE